MNQEDWKISDSNRSWVSWLNSSTWEWESWLSRRHQWPSHLCPLTPQSWVTSPGRDRECCNPASHTHTHTSRALLTPAGDGWCNICPDRHSLRSSLCRSCLCSWSWSWWAQTRRCRPALLRRPAHEPSSCTWPDSHSPAPPVHQQQIREIHAVCFIVTLQNKAQSTFINTFIFYCLYLFIRISIKGHIHYNNKHKNNAIYKYISYTTF